MLKKGILGLMVLGLLLIGFSVGKEQIFHHKINQAVQQAKKEFAISKKAEASTGSHSIPTYKDGDRIGVLTIDKVDMAFPIYQGVAKKELSVGAGHYKKTALPGENNQIVIPAHNTTDFAKIRELDAGDNIQIETVYGVFHYQVRDTDIINEKQVNIIHNTSPKEELVLFTCYPFNGAWHPDRRYVVYADKVSQNLVRHQ